MIKTYKEALESIFKFEETRDYSLERVFKAMELLNNPLKNIKIIHIAGTNWKGSVSRMVYSVLKNAWKSVWTFNQPHLVDIRERFLTSKWMITKKEFLLILNKILSLPLDLSYFEKTTLIAFLFFELKEVEYACVEVWFWWLLDSTNVVNPCITAITSIWFDHTDFLWDTLEKISYHKAWIIKPWIPIVYNHENKVIEKIAIEKEAPIIFTKKEFETNLKWDYQKRNAWIAYKICKYLWFDEAQILSWFQKIEHNWRLQKISKNLIIDWAHNIDWLKELKKYVDKNFKDKFSKIYYCFSLKNWKTPENILNIFWFENNYIYVLWKNKILEDDENISAFFEKKDVSFKKLIPEEIYKKSKKEKDNLFLVFWSLYMIGEFLEFKEY